MSEVVTEWCHEHSIIPIQPLYTSVLDMPADNKETQRKKRIVCSLVGVVYSEDDNGNQQAKAQEEIQTEVFEQVVEQLVHKGYNVQVGTLRPDSKIPSDHREAG